MSTRPAAGPAVGAPHQGPALASSEIVLAAAAWSVADADAGAATAAADPPPAAAGVGAAAAAALRALAAGRRAEEGADPLAALAPVAERLAQLVARRLAAATGQDAQVRALDPRAERLSDYLRVAVVPSVLVTFRAPAWERDGLLRLDRDLAFAILDHLLGGGHGVPPARRRGQACTAIETRLMGRLAAELLGDLATALARVASLRFGTGRVDTDVRRVDLGDPGDRCLTLPLAAEIATCAGAVDLVLPGVALEPPRERPDGASAAAGAPATAGRWRQELERWVRSLDVKVEAVLDERTVALGDVARLAPGSRLELGLRCDAPVRLRCGDAWLAAGSVGHRDERLVVTVERRTDPNGDGDDAELPG